MNQNMAMRVLKPLDNIAENLNKQKQLISMLNVYLKDEQTDQAQYRDLKEKTREGLKPIKT